MLKTGVASTDKQDSKVADSPERFVTRMLYGSCAPKKELCGIKAVS